MIHLNKIAVALFVLLLMTKSSLYGQIAFNPHATESFYQITSYLGKEGGERANTFQFDWSGLNVNVPNWSLSVRLLQPVSIVEAAPSRNGQTFPLDKISFRWTNDNGNPNINLQTIGASRNDILLQNANEVMLIDRSNTAFQSYGNHATQILLYGTIKIAQGKYLENYQSANPWGYIQYRIPLMYTLYDKDRNVLGTRAVDYQIQIFPTLTDGHLVDVEPEYSLQIGAQATDATLRFFTLRDYTDGVSLSFDNAVKVNSKTNFELRVKSLDTELVRAEGGALPLSILSTRLTAGQGAKGITSSSNVTLSTDERVLLSGTSDNNKTAQHFNLHYKASLTQPQILSAKPGNYSVSLLYLLIPK